jgi:hypothetical protein
MRWLDKSAALSEIAVAAKSGIVVSNLVLPPHFLPGRGKMS